MNETYIVILLGIAGVAFNCTIKMMHLKSDADSLNVKFNWGMYFKKDYIAIIAAFLSVAIWYGIFGEWAKKFPQIVDIKRTLFVVAGYSGSSLIQLGFDTFTASAKKYIKSYANVKSNISDMQTGVTPTSTIQEVIKKGEEATGGADVTKSPPAPKDVETPKDK